MNRYVAGLDFVGPKTKPLEVIKLWNINISVNINMLYKIITNSAEGAGTLTHWTRNKVLSGIFYDSKSK